MFGRRGITQAGVRQGVFVVQGGGGGSPPSSWPSLVLDVKGARHWCCLGVTDRELPSDVHRNTESPLGVGLALALAGGCGERWYVGDDSDTRLDSYTVCMWACFEEQPQTLWWYAGGARVEVRGGGKAKQATGSHGMKTRGWNARGGRGRGVIPQFEGWVSTRGQACKSRAVHPSARPSPVLGGRGVEDVTIVIALGPSMSRGCRAQFCRRGSGDGPPRLVGNRAGMGPGPGPCRPIMGVWSMNASEGSYSLEWRRLRRTVWRGLPDGLVQPRGRWAGGLGGSRGCRWRRDVVNKPWSLPAWVAVLRRRLRLVPASSTNTWYGQGFVVQ